MHYAGIGLMKAKRVSCLRSLDGLQCAASAAPRRETGAGMCFCLDLGLVRLLAGAPAIENAKLAPAGLDDAHLGPRRQQRLRGQALDRRERAPIRPDDVVTLQATAQQRL